jgi:hypothetical protein
LQQKNSISTTAAQDKPRTFFLPAKNLAVEERDGTHAVPDIAAILEYFRIVP